MKKELKRQIKKSEADAQFIANKENANFSTVAHDVIKHNYTTTAAVTTANLQKRTAFGSSYVAGTARQFGGSSKHSYNNNDLSSK